MSYRSGWFAHVVWTWRSWGWVLDVTRRGPQVVCKLGPVGFAVGRYWS